MVTMFLSPIVTANRNSFQVPMRSRIATAAIPVPAAGIVTRNRVPRREQPSIRAAEFERSRHLLEHAPQQPHDERQPEGDVDQDQALERVLEADALRDEQDRDHVDDRRHHLGEDQDRHDQPLAGQR